MTGTNRKMAQLESRTGTGTIIITRIITSQYISKAGLRIRIHFIRIRIQHFRLNRYRSGSGSGSRALMTKNREKKLQLKQKFNFFWIKNYKLPYLSRGLHKDRSSYRRSLQISKEAIQHFKTWAFKNFFYFRGSFLPSWIRIRIPNPDPLTRLNPDPDLQPWSKDHFFLHK